VTDPRWQPVVDRAWAATFGLSVEELHRPGTQVVGALPGGYRGIYILRLGDAVIVSVPPDPGPLGLALGPSWHGYLHGADFSYEATGIGRQLTTDDAPAVGAFKTSVPAADYEEAGFDKGMPAGIWGAFDGGSLVAMSHATTVGKLADIGVVTTPAARGRGIATALVADMLAGSFLEHDVARYRARVSNQPSLALAKRLGFEGYGENVAIRFG
jgi:ribosomal protein S18 acetylase RimI-like enzyme